MEKNCDMQMVYLNENYNDAAHVAKIKKQIYIKHMTVDNPLLLLKKSYSTLNTLN
jgi:hypothetical protein